MADHMRLLAAIEEADGELTPEMEQALQINEKELQEGCISFAYVVKSLEATESAIENEIRRLHGLNAKVTKRLALFKKAISDAMNLYRVESIHGSTIHLTFRKADSVLVENAALVPLEYKKQPEPVVSKELIKEAIKSGKDVPGASIVTNRHLQIK